MCRHVFSWSTSRAPVQTHYLLNESVLPLKTCRPLKCNTAKLIKRLEPCLTRWRKRYRRVEDDGWRLSPDVWFFEFVGTDSHWRTQWVTLHLQWCNSSDAHEPESSQHLLLTSAWEENLLLPAKSINYTQTPTEHSQAQESCKHPESCAEYVHYAFFSLPQQISSSVHVKMSLWCNNPRPFTSLHNPLCINCKAPTAAFLSCHSIPSCSIQDT